MSAWDIGPFDNKVAADFCDALDGSTPAVRMELVRTALMIATDKGVVLELDEGCEAVASAALVAEQLPGGERENSDHRPKAPLPDYTGLRRLAARALDRVVADDSELRDQWAEKDGAAWLDAVAKRRAVLGDLPEDGHG